MDMPAGGGDYYGGPPPPEPPCPPPPGPPYPPSTDPQYPAQQPPYNPYPADPAPPLNGPPPPPPPFFNGPAPDPNFNYHQPHPPPAPPVNADSFGGGGGFWPGGNSGGGGSGGGYGGSGGYGGGYAASYHGRKRPRHASQHGDGSGYPKIYVASVPRTATEEDIRPVFEPHGKVVEVILLRDKRTGQQQGSCFVKYSTTEEADKAIKALNDNFTFQGEPTPLKVRYADGERDRLGLARNPRGGQWAGPPSGAPHGDNFGGQWAAPPPGFPVDKAPPSGFKGDGVPPRGFGGDAAPPPGFSGDAAPPGFSGDAPPPPGFNGHGAPPPGFNGGPAPPPGFNGEAALPPGFNGEAAPPPGFKGDAAPPLGFKGDTAPPPGFKGDTAPPPGFCNDPAPPPSFKGNNHGRQWGAPKPAFKGENRGLLADKVYVSGVNKYASKHDIEEIFSPYGFVEDIFIIRDEMKQSRGCAFVKYSNNEMATAAITALNGSFIMRGCEVPLTVRFAEPKKPRGGETRGNNPSSSSYYGLHSREPLKRHAPHSSDSMGGFMPPIPPHHMQQQFKSPMPNEVPEDNSMMQQPVQSLQQTPPQLSRCPTPHAETPEISQTPENVGSESWAEPDKLQTSNQKPEQQQQRQSSQGPPEQVDKFMKAQAHCDHQITVNTSTTSTDDQAAAPLECDWSQHICPDGFKYYYNCVTCESAWEKPDEFARFEEEREKQ